MISFVRNECFTLHLFCLFLVKRLEVCYCDSFQTCLNKALLTNWHPGRVCLGRCNMMLLHDMGTQVIAWLRVHLVGNRVWYMGPRHCNPMPGFQFVSWWAKVACPRLGRMWTRFFWLPLSLVQNRGDCLCVCVCTLSGFLLELG